MQKQDYVLIKTPESPFFPTMWFGKKKLGLYSKYSRGFWADEPAHKVTSCLRFTSLLRNPAHVSFMLVPLQAREQHRLPHPNVPFFIYLFFFSFWLHAAPEMSVRMSNLDNERDERDEDSHEDRGISECSLIIPWLKTLLFEFRRGLTLWRKSI